MSCGGLDIVSGVVELNFHPGLMVVLSHHMIDSLTNAQVALAAAATFYYEPRV